MPPKKTSRASAARKSKASASAAPQEDVKPQHPRSVSDFLGVHSALVPGEAFATLMRLEKRPLPDLISSDDMQPRHHPRLCCFDTSGLPAAWTAHNICERCKLLNELLQLPATSAASAALKGLLGIALHTTDCQSQDAVPRAQPLTLPRSMLGSIVRIATDEMRNTQDGSALRALMHVSASTRCHAASSFRSVSLYECDNPVVRQVPKLRVPTPLIKFVLDQVEWWLRDPVYKRKNFWAAPALPACRDCLATTVGQYCQAVGFQVTIETDPLPTHTGGTAPKQAYTYSKMIGKAEPGNKDVRQACRALQLTLEAAGSPPRFVNPYHWALMGSFSLPRTAGAIITITMFLGDDLGGVNGNYKKVWRFDSHGIRPDAKY